MRKTAPKKKMNRKMKRTIRKSVSAMFMATALIIAAIPVQENAAAGTLATGDGTTTVETEPLSENSYPLDENGVLESQYEIPGYEYDIYDETKAVPGWVIVDEGGYVKRQMYLIQKHGVECAIVAYNKDVIPKDNGTSGTLVIPNEVAAEYWEFTMDDVKAKYYDGEKPKTGDLQTDYDLWHPGNQKVDFEKMDPGQIEKYALDLYACGLAVSGDCIAEKVRVTSEDEDSMESKTTYVPFDTAKQEFAMKVSYPISVIAAGAFSEHAFSQVNQDADKTESVKIYNLIIGDHIKGIGDEAFKGSANLQSLTLGMANTTIGNHAFQDCAGLQEVNFAKTIQIIGAEAFRGCNALSSVKLTGALQTIGTGAFADCGGLTTVDMTEVTSNNDIGDYAFYNCLKLNDVKFTEHDSTKTIGTGAFAVSDGLSNSVTGSWKEVEFPDGVTGFGESVLEGRTNLTSCVLPQSYGASSTQSKTLDGGFFRRCTNLKSVTIKGPFVQFCIEGSVKERQCNPFWWVTSEEFYVEGPANLDDSAEYKNPFNYSFPRTSTQRAHKTFKFTTKDGVEYYEIAVAREDDPSTPDIDESKEYADYYLVNAKTGALECYTPDPNAPAASDVIIRIVGNYNGVSVKSIAEGCFDSVKDRAVGLIVDDNTIEEISERAFADFTALKTVELGNSITKIGKEAFAGCEALTDVHFKMDKVTIEKDAFKTNGTKGLIFHGKIEKGFEPFDFAMNKDNDIDGQGRRILYKSLEPSNLSVIYDNKASTDEKPVVTLISYPIYNADDTQATLAKNALYEESVKNIVIPSGVTSIDSAFYYTNGANERSIEAYVAPYTNSKQSIYLTWQASIGSSLTRSADTEADVVPGIFSGVYDDFAVGIVEGEKESLLRGNDYIEKVEMSTVEKLPDFAFESCESLNSVILGEGMTDLGIAPFRGCTSLAAVGGNSKFICENSIIYEVKADGTYKLVECLPGRADNSISNATDPSIDKVSEIGISAFEDCTNIQLVDLHTATNLKVIPKNCFRACTSLKQVLLPESVNEIREGAFKDIKVKTATGEWTSSLTVRIPAREVYINSEAFDKMKDVTIETYEDTSAWRFANDNGLTAKLLIEENHTVQFLDWDFTELHSASIPHGGNVIFPSDKTPSRENYKFTGWRCLTSGVTYESPILDDYIFVAQYEPVGGAGGGTGDGNGGGNGNGGNGGQNGDGTNTDGTDKDKEDEDKDKEDEDKDKDDEDKDKDKEGVYSVTVINGSGSGSYKQGATVIITANDPAAGKKFKNWTTDNTNITLASTRLAATTFTMPAGNVTVTANYEDNKSSSGSSSTVSGNSNRDTSGGTKVIITRPGISDTDLAAAKVNGSKDGFIVKISETAEATAAVEAALMNKYGSLDNIRYCAMDISLYDSTGTTKITDTTGYTVDITIPIPDALKEYAGNNKTVAVVNSQLENLAPKFSTIDGVPCVTFRATHFSPYTVYVDTQNLSATGTLDSTPKTGDGIHPKWFLSIGLACISVALFMKKDRRTVKVNVA